MKLRLGYIVLASLIVAGCAQVPRQSVELSATIGRDLAVVHKAHRELARAMFARMRRDVNRFVDEVYSPYQIRKAMSRQKELATSSNPEDQNKSLLLAINEAFKSDAPPQLQDEVLKAMDIMARKIRNDTESMRRKLLAPLDAQETEVLDSIDRAYLQLHYANSIVTGHLSSVAKVHEAQAELLNAVGVDQDLRKGVGERLTKVSDMIEVLVVGGESIDAQVAQAEEAAQKIKAEIEKIGERLTDSQKEK